MNDAHTYGAPVHDTIDDGAVSEPERLTIGQAARYLGYSISSMRRYDKTGVLPAQRTPGKQRRWLRSDLDAWRINGDRAA